jgi:peptidoglycan glycosyltransferase
MSASFLPMSRQLRRIALAFAAAFLLITGAAGYWGYVQRDSLLSRADNPRRLLAERRVPRGMIYDRHDAVLAESIGTPGEFMRHYPYPDLAPVLGYVSPFYGTAGIEAAADATLHGDEGHDALSLYWQGTVLGAPFPGRAVRLSIDLQLQTAADKALGGRTGAVVLLDAVTGEVLALASHPTYNPNTLEAQWETLVNDPQAPLLNRATLNLYQPGGALQPIVQAAALRAGLAKLDAPYPSAAAEVTVSNLTLTCITQPASGSITLAEAFQAGCPRPFADFGEQFGAHALDQLFADFRLFDAPLLPIPAAASPRPAVASEAMLATIGQSRLTITPLHLALITAAIARRGEMPAPQLLMAAQDPAGAWKDIPPTSHAIAAIAPEYAEQVKALMPDGHPAIALTNAEGKKLAWFSGFAPLADSRYTVAVLLEDGDVDAAAQMGRILLNTAVTP